MQLEVCIDSIESAAAAQRGGANRLEICAALTLGGITPSCGLIEQCRELGGLDLMVMIRPHGGGFCYDGGAIDTMLCDIRVAQRLGVRGVVIGALTASGQIDVDACRRLIDAARPLEVTFHRAFDETTDPWRALDELVELGVDRLLTSGQASTAADGAPLIRKMVERVGSRISVMPGGGIHAGNVVELVRATGVVEVHASASELVASRRITRADRVRSIVEAIKNG